MEITGKRHGVVERPARGNLLRFLFGRWSVVLAVADALALAFVAVMCRSVPFELIVAFVVTIPLLFMSTGLYSGRLDSISFDEAPVAIHVITLSAMTLVTLNFMIFRLPLAPVQVLQLWLAAVVCVPIARTLGAPLHRVVVRTSVRRNTIIVGSGQSAVLVANKIDAHPELGLTVSGFVDEGPRQSVRGRHEPLLGNVKHLAKAIHDHDVEVVVLAFVKNNYMDILKALYRAEPKVEVLIMPRYFEFLSAGVRIDDLAGMPMLGMNRKDPSLVQRLVKRIEDVVCGSLLLLIALPLFPSIALAIKLDSPGPVFFNHPRIGKDGRPFKVYKFRSMEQDADKDEKALEKLGEEDPRGLKNRADVRVTRVGRILRKTSLDELPQLFNVIKGDMSLVGPRPPVASEVEAYEEWQKKRLSVRPGITGLWQVSGRSNLPFDERIWLDFMYIDSWSPWLDLRILLQTIPAVISMRGAY